MKKLILIDGHAILHRAFHALPPMTNSAGIPTNAVYGFIGMLIRVIEELKPTHLAVVFDMPGGTFRNELYKEYQSQRPPMDDSLRPQIASVHEVVTALDIPIFEKEGFEADDLIGTLSKLAPKNGIDEVIVVTGDRDLLQLVNKQVKLFMPIKGLAEAMLYGEKEATTRMGVPPSQVADLKGLMGDASDNYPGVAGIGPKTAIGLLEKFGSVEEVYKNLDKVTPEGVKNKLEKGRDDALISLKLARVVTDAPISFDTKKAELPKDLLTKAVIDTFAKFEFRTLLKRLSKLAGKDVSVEVQKIEEKKKKKISEDQMGLF